MADYDGTYDRQQNDYRSNLQEPLLLRHHVAPEMETPNLGNFKKEVDTPTNKSIFKITAREL